VDDVQLVFYYYGVTRGLGLPVSKLTYQYLAADQIITVAVDEDVMASKLIQLRDLADRLASTTVFAPRQNRFCVDCLAQPTCSEFTTGG
jgi:hypothetical protein